jgi:regulator of nucleoside diphosphate kinase
MSKNQAVVTAQDLRGLEEMIRSMRTVGDPYGPYLDALRRRLDGADVVDEALVDGRVATMGSLLRIRDPAGGPSEPVRLVYAHEAGPLASHLSVLTNLGTALLGAREGDLVEWWAYRGRASVWLEEIVDQPAADAGRFAELSKE